MCMQGYLKKHKLFQTQHKTKIIHTDPHWRLLVRLPKAPYYLRLHPTPLLSTPCFLEKLELEITGKTYRLFHCMPCHKNTKNLQHELKKNQMVSRNKTISLPPSRVAHSSMKITPLFLLFRRSSLLVWSALLLGFSRLHSLLP